MKNFSISENVFVVTGLFYIVVDAELTIFTNKGNWIIKHWSVELCDEYGDYDRIRFYTCTKDKSDSNLSDTIRIWNRSDAVLKEYGDYKYPDYNVDNECFLTLVNFLNEICYNIRIFKNKLL